LNKKFKGKSKIYVVDRGETINQTKYIEILKENLVDWANSLYTDGFWELWQDNATPHTGKETTKWLNENIFFMFCLFANLANICKKAYFSIKKFST